MTYLISAASVVALVLGLFAGYVTYRKVWPSMSAKPRKYEPVNARRIYHESVVGVQTWIGPGYSF